MATDGTTSAQPLCGITSGRLSSGDYARNFRDLHPRFDPHEALIEADRCYFCFDAPCMVACPTGIDVAMFIRRIATGNTAGAAETILKSNILGGMCARACPTETLCEEACVRNMAEGQPVRIGRLQRYAVDYAMEHDLHFFSRATEKNRKHIAVVGSGPASLACAHALACNGHDITLFEARDKLGGLNEYGIAVYKTVENFAQREIEYILAIGGIEVKTGTALGRDVDLHTLRRDHDAVFLGLGMGDTNDLNIEGEGLDGVLDAVDYIAGLRQASDLARLAVGRSVVVIGGGMTAIDIAVQISYLGAEDITMVYRRGPEQMKASGFEQRLARDSGVRIRHWGVPRRFLGENGKVVGVEFGRVSPVSGGSLEETGETFILEADQVFKAIGQSFVAESVAAAGVALTGGRIAVDGQRRTSLEDVWAGGDCVAGGQDLTVSAVEDGKVAARAIHARLSAA